MPKTENEVKLDKIVLNIDGTKIPLSVEQAKKLKEILGELFGKEIVKEVEHHYHKDWWYRPYLPVYGSGTTASTQPAVLKDAVYCSNTLELSC